MGSSVQLAVPSSAPPRDKHAEPAAAFDDEAAPRLGTGDIAFEDRRSEASNERRFPGRLVRGSDRWPAALHRLDREKRIERGRPPKTAPGRSTRAHSRTTTGLSMWHIASWLQAASIQPSRKGRSSTRARTGRQRSASSSAVAEARSLRCISWSRSTQTTVELKRRAMKRAGAPNAEPLRGCDLRWRIHTEPRVRQGRPSPPRSRGADEGQQNGAPRPSRLRRKPRCYRAKRPGPWGPAYALQPNSTPVGRARLDTSRQKREASVYG